MFVRRDFQYAVFVAARLVAQRNRNVTGNPSRGVVLRGNSTKRQQAALRAG